MKEHLCAPFNYCICSAQALEPNERCPVHGFGFYPDKCRFCGRFISKSASNIKENSHNDLQIVYK